MASTVWFGLALGAGIGILYGAAVFGVVHLANRFQDNRFLLVIFGGILFRMIATLLVVSAVLLLVPVHLPAFGSSLAITILLALALEIGMLYRRLKPKSGSVTRKPFSS
jgi:hypothetical protein